ncbi:MAG: hypothetical protein EA347_03935, partial [Thioalkalivibrio sp.]
MIAARIPSILLVLAVLLASCATVDAPDSEAVSARDSDTVSVPDFDKGLQAANRLRLRARHFNSRRLAAAGTAAA